jgi:hypothetical protein
LRNRDAQRKEIYKKIENLSKVGKNFNRKLTAPVASSSRSCTRRPGTSGAPKSRTTSWGSKRR